MCACVCIYVCVCVLLFLIYFFTCGIVYFQFMLLSFQKRDVLSRTKQARDSLRIDNTRLRQNCGLLGNEPLLRDFEERKDEGDDLKSKLDRLKMQHAELTLNCNQVRRKIEQARTGRP